MALVEISGGFASDQLHIVGEHHDALLLCIQTYYTRRLLPQAIRMMEKPKMLGELGIELPIPMRVDASIGPWGRGKKFVVSSEDKDTI
jgi:hypothetical protein